ncbi:unnamed protein product [Caenorhabditis sp. 36 PRJEB53466]|nr:unnamed protein product [Caenorhabditis sp. 36 PRJEB53466]
MSRWLLVFLFLSVTSVSSEDLRISGIRNGPPAVSRLNPNEKFKLKVYGNNLKATDDFYFTTATRCEDFHLTNISAVSTVRAVPVRRSPDCRSVTLQVPGGLPFDTSNHVYHLCHRNGTYPMGEKYLRVEKIIVEHKNYSIDQFLLCLFCILMAAYSSGMTLGYMKFSIVELNNMINTGDASTANRAQRILRFRRRSNWLVVAFSLFSSVFTVIFTTRVERMLDGSPNEEMLKILVPSLILFCFAEMLPQAICNSKLGFNLASGLWFITLLIFAVTSPISLPASLILGRFLKRNVREVLTEEEKTCMIRNMANQQENQQEKTILENAMTFSSKKVRDLMVPIEQVFTLSQSQKLDRSTILTLVEKGYTRVPIHDDKNKDTIVGMLNMKDLNTITSMLSREPTVEAVLAHLSKKVSTAKKSVKYVNDEMNAQLLLRQMQTGDFHFACVAKYLPYGPEIVGIITIEDILEQLFGKIDGNNENRTRSSVDDRADNKVIVWCRGAGNDPKYPLSFSHQLRIIQYVLKECSVFRSLDIGVLKIKELLSSDRIRTAKEGTKISVDDRLIVIWKGAVRVTNRKETFEKKLQQVPVKLSPDETDKENSDNAEELVEATPPPPVLVLGKAVLKNLVDRVCCPFKEPITDEDIIEDCQALTDVSYFKLRLSDLLTTINGVEEDVVKKMDAAMKPMNILSQRPSHSTSTRMDSPAVSVQSEPTEITPLLGPR